MEGMGREVEGQHPATRRKVELSGCQFLVSFKMSDTSWQRLSDVRL